MKTKIIFAAAAMLSFGALSSAQVIFEDDFEAYSAVADLETVGSWNAPEGSLAISTAQNNTASGTNSLFEAKGDATSRVTLGFGPQPVGVGDTLTVTYYTLGENLGANIFRSGLNLAAYDSDPWGAGALEELIAFGWYHSNATTNYAARVAFGGANWQDSGLAFTLDSWDKLEITLTDGTDASFDVNDSGTPYTDTTTVTPTVGYNGLRLGSYLGFGTANDLDIYYDDVSVVFSSASDVNEWHMY